MSKIMQKGKIATTFSLIAISVSMIFLCGITFSSCGKPAPDEVGRVNTIEKDNPDESGVCDTFVVKGLGNDVDFHTPLQQEYLAAEYEEFFSKDNAARPIGKAELSRPLPVVIDWYFDPTDVDAEDFVEYEVKLAENKKMMEAAVYTVTESQLEIYNLKIATDYYYTIEAVYENNVTYLSKTQRFRTTDVGPRNLYVDGISNCRDLGGRETADGGVIRQGLIYRTSCLHDGNNKNIQLTAAGEKTMRELGVKTEIELRGDSSGDAGGKNASSVSDLGSDVTFVYAPMRYSNVPNLLLGNCEMTRLCFQVLADENNYPVFYHCRIGTDRTGFMTMLIGGLIGIDEDTLYRDYLFSNFGFIESERSLGDKTSENSVYGYMNMLKAYPGDSFSQKVYNYLLSIGVTADELDSVISILKDGGSTVSSAAAFVEAEHIAPSQGISPERGQKVSYAIGQTTQSLNYYNTNGKSGETLTVNVKSSAAVKADAYIYVNPTAVNGSLSSAFQCNVNGKPLALSSASFSSLGYAVNAWMPTWTPVKLGTVDLQKGDNSLSLIISNFGINVGGVTIIPQNKATLTKDTNSYLPAEPTVCNHVWIKTDKTPVTGETKGTYYVCSKCGGAYSLIEAENCENRNIQTASNVTDKTIKLGNAGDWIELKVYVSAATKAEVALHATVSASSSTHEVNSALNFTVNGTSVNSTASGTYADYGLTETNFADVPLGMVQLKAGLNTIRVNRYGNYGCTIDYITVLTK